jgi:hypothetical protein
MIARRLLLTSLMLFSSVSLANAHWEDPSGCAKTHEKIMSFKEWDRTYHGVSEDGRDYVYRWKQKDTNLATEEHFMLLPPSQWEKKDEPEHMPMPLSEWIDWDGNGHYDEWFLFPRGTPDCNDALHFVWDNKDQTYKLYATGKERT